VLGFATADARADLPGVRCPTLLVPAAHDLLLPPALAERVEYWVAGSANKGGYERPLRAAAATYFDLSGDGRSILAMRGALGSLVNAQADHVPRSQRFYAGGGGSVRGYDFQSIGPRDARNKPAGGASLIEASVEFRQRIGQSFGAVAFVDAGAVGTQAFAPTDAMRVGAGLGLRYYTPIGPIRADVALPLIRQQGSGAFGFYVGLGHAY
jgi:translocation and assembly module TamA